MSPFICIFTFSNILSYIHVFIHISQYSFSFIQSFMYSFFIHIFICSSIHLFTYSIMYSFIPPYIHLFIYSLFIFIVCTRRPQTVSPYKQTRESASSVSRKTKTRNNRKSPIVEIACQCASQKGAQSNIRLIVTASVYCTGTRTYAYAYVRVLASTVQIYSQYYQPVSRCTGPAARERVLNFLKLFLCGSWFLG